MQRHVPAHLWRGSRRLPVLRKRCACHGAATDRFGVLSKLGAELERLYIHHNLGVELSTASLTVTITQHSSRHHPQRGGQERAHCTHCALLAHTPPPTPTPPPLMHNPSAHPPAPHRTPPHPPHPHAVLLARQGLRDADAREASERRPEPV